MEFTAPSYIATETGALVQISVRRIFSSGVVSVDYSTSNGTAEAGSDYVSSNATLVFADGQTNAGITLTILDDSLVESLETFYVILSNPSNGAIIGTNSETTIEVVSEDGAVYAEYFRTDPGWTNQGQWQFGAPLGLGGAYGNPHPKEGHTGPIVYGYNFAGAY